MQGLGGHVESMVTYLKDQAKSLKAKPSLSIDFAPTSAPAAAQLRLPPPSRPRPPAGGNGEAAIGGSEQRILDAIRWWNVLGVAAPSHAQTAFIAGFSHKSGTWATYLSRLRSKGLIEGRGDLVLTDEGAAFAAEPASAPTTAAPGRGARQDRRAAAQDPDTPARSLPPGTEPRAYRCGGRLQPFVRHLGHLSQPASFARVDRRPRRAEGRAMVVCDMRLIPAARDRPAAGRDRSRGHRSHHQAGRVTGPGRPRGRADPRRTVRQRLARADRQHSPAAGCRRGRRRLWRCLLIACSGQTFTLSQRADLCEERGRELMAATGV